jgi:HAD superfamily hydrolase (TIGR01509 family)
MKEKLLICDCDGVLVDSEPLAAEAYVRVYDRHGLPIGADLIAQCVGMKQADILVRIHEVTGHRLPEAALGDLWTETKLLFDQKLEPTQGVARFLDAHPGVRCVASSSSLERIAHSLQRTGLARFFGEAIFSASMVKRGKPAPDIFLYAAERMGFAPADCIVVEDSSFGIQGAVAANMRAIGYVGGSHTYPGHAEKLLSAGAEKVFSSWQSMREELLESA